MEASNGGSKHDEKNFGTVKLIEKFPFYEKVIKCPKLYFCNTQQLIGAVFALSMLTTDRRKRNEDQEFYKWSKELRILQGNLWTFDTTPYETMLEMYKEC